MNHRYLIIALVLIGSITIISSVYAQSEPLPSWIKNTASWWAADEVEDHEFFNLIEFLIEREIITVPGNQDDSQRVQELENQLSNLKRQTIQDIQSAYDDGYQDGHADRSTREPTPTRENLDDEIIILINASESFDFVNMNSVVEIEAIVSDVINGHSLGYTIVESISGNIISIDQVVVSEEYGSGIFNLKISERYKIGFLYNVEVHYGNEIGEASFIVK